MIGHWIVALFFYGFFQCALPAQLKCYKDSLSNYTTIEFNNPKVLFNSSCYNPALPVVVFAFGFNGKVGGPATTAVLTAYLNTKKRNVLLLDWEDEADPSFYGLKVGYAIKGVPNAKAVGEEFGKALVTLGEAGLDMNKVHLLGLSLGAHLMCHAGRCSREKGHTVGRITGLDPARILYEGLFTVQKGLDRTCAIFVDIIHSNPGNYGTEKSHGTVDFWPNYASRPLQPGCPNGSYPMFSTEDLCSHNRAWEYYIETLLSPTAFPAVGAESYDDFIKCDRDTNVTCYLGAIADTRASGNFYLTTSDHSPFGLNAESLRPSNHQRTSRRAPISVIEKLMRVLG